MSIQIDQVSKRFGDFIALNQVSLEVPRGKLVALLGPSGSGKTTLLRVISGLEFPDSGRVLIDGADVTNRHVRDRQIGFVFQHYALFRHMTVFENVAFGLRVRGVARAEVAARVDELLGLVRLEGLGRRYPAELSGGQRQRVALARALAVRPNLLLLDEPFGALDAKVRQELRTWLRRLHEQMPVTTVFVTHDQEEAFEVADQVVVLRRGKIEQVGTPNEVFDHPATPFVMDFLGNVNVFHGRAQSGRVDVGPFQLDYPHYDQETARDATAYVRPHDLTVDLQPHHPQSLAVRVLQLNPAGSIVKARVVAESLGIELNVDLVRERARELDLKVGDHAYVAPSNVRVFMPHDFTI